MKRHHPREYMAALLTSVLDSSAKVAEYIAECRDMGIRLMPPDVNESDAWFTVSGGDIRFGLVAIKNIGEKFILQLMEERGPTGVQVPGGLLPAYVRKELNRRAVESLIRSGAFDGTGVKRRAMMLMLDAVLEGIAGEGRRNIAGQYDLFGGEAEDAAGASVPSRTPRSTRAASLWRWSARRRASTSPATLWTSTATRPAPRRRQHRRHPLRLLRRGRA